MSFWWWRWTEQSRSPRQTTLPASSASTWTSMCRAGWTYFSMYTDPSPKEASPSATAQGVGLGHLVGGGDQADAPAAPAALALSITG